MGKDQTRIGVVSDSSMNRRDLNLGSITKPEDILDLIWEIDPMAEMTNTADGLSKMNDMFME